MRAGRWAAALGLVLLCGCFQTKDELTLEANGSGKVRLEVRTSLPAEMLDGLGMGMFGGMGGGGESVIYPPASEAEAKKFFPARDFTVSVKEDRLGDTGRVMVIEAAFKDVNALLASPYGRAHALSLKLEGGRLVLEALAGTEAVARLAEMKDENGLFGRQLPGLADLDKSKGELRSEFRVTLPNAVTATNGTPDGRTVTWAAERAKYTNAAEFAQQLGAMLTASCATNGCTFSPFTPARLALRPFKELPAGASAGRGKAPDAAKVAAAAKFVPYALQVTQTLDLSGEGNAGQNAAQLIGAVVLPREFAPQKWGEAKLEEVVDAKGNSLKTETDRNEFFGMRRFAAPEPEEEEDGEKPDQSPDERKTVTLSFQPPDWKVKEIARLKGSINLQYLGGTQHVVKLTNAVPAKWIMDASKPTEMAMDIQGGARSLSSPALPELGLTLNFQMGMAQAGYTMLMLQVSGEKAVLSDAQVFDAEGRPWPTFLQQQAYGDQDSCSLMVAGRPVPPLSIALLATGIGANVEVPILLEKIPVGRK